MLEFLLLGPLSVRVHNRVIVVRGQKQAALLCILLAADRAPVSSERLVSELWGGTPPGDPLMALRGQIARLRRKLNKWEPGATWQQKLIFCYPGYLLDVPSTETDAGLFLHEVAAGHRLAGTNPREAISTLRAALDRWRGAVFDGVPLGVDGANFAQFLHEKKITAFQDLALAHMRIGEWSSVVANLEILLRENPFNEQFADQLMTAYHQLGRIPDSLRVYHDLRRRFSEELGIDPGPTLRARMSSILRQDVEYGETREYSFERREVVGFPTRARHEVGCDMAGGLPLSDSSSLVGAVLSAEGNDRVDTTISFVVGFADPDSFIELSRDDRSRVVTGLCAVDGRDVAVYEISVGALRDALEDQDIAKIIRIYTYALRARIPIIAFFGSNIAHVELADDVIVRWRILLEAAGRLARVVPRVIVHTAADSDKADVSHELGDIVVEADGRCKFAALWWPGTSGRQERLSGCTPGWRAAARRLLSNLPGSHRNVQTHQPLRCHIPSTPALITDPINDLNALEVIHEIADDGSVQEFQSGDDSHLVMVLARIERMPVGLISFRVSHLPGRTDHSAVGLRERFVRFCEDFSIPVVVLLDGAEVDASLELTDGQIGSRDIGLPQALWAAQAPRITVVMREPSSGVTMEHIACGGMGPVLVWSSGFRSWSADRLVTDEVIDPGQTGPVVAAMLRCLHEDLVLQPCGGARTRYFGV